MWKKIKKAKDENSLEEAENYVLWLLGTRWWGEKELRDRLERKGFSDTVIKQTLFSAKKQKYLDDSRLLEAWIEKFRERETYGRIYIEQKLRVKGFSVSDIKQALNNGFSEQDEKNAAKRFLEKQSRLTKGSFLDEAEKRKLIAKMQRRGFPLSLVLKLVLSVLNSEMVEED